MPRNTFYRKMRGDTPLNTDDLERIARALDVDPFAILHAASATNVIRGNFGVRGTREDLGEVAAHTDINHDKDHDDYDA